jgi:hypothetical protein
MKKTLLTMVLMAGSTFAQAPYPAGPNPGATENYPPARANAPEQGPYSVGPGAGAQGYYPPAACAPGSVWIDGYNDANGYFVNGYCTVPPFVGAYWVAPGFFGGRFVAGYWGRGGLGFGYAPGFGFRGGYGPNYGFRGGYSAGSRLAAPNFRAQGSYRGSAMRGGGAGHGGRR